MTISDTGRPGYVWDGTEWVPILGAGVPDTGWVTVTPPVGWSHYGNTYPPLSYRIIAGTCHWRGLVLRDAAAFQMGAVIMGPGTFPAVTNPAMKHRALVSTYTQARDRLSMAEFIPDGSLALFGMESLALAGTFDQGGILNLFTSYPVVPLGGGAGGLPEPWRPLTLTTGLVPLAGWVVPRYRKDRGSVEVEFMATSPSVAFPNGSLLAILPEGYRPLSQVRFTGTARINADGTNDSFSFDVYPDGTIKITGPGAGYVAAGSMAFVARFGTD
jgi:hypothetical protein